MKRGSTLFLKLVILLLGIAALAAMIRLPLTEGRAVNLDLMSIYSDPFIVYSYLASIPFFAVLYQAFKLLGYIGDNKVFSPSSVKALSNIKYYAIIQSIAIVGSAVYIRMFHAAGDDPAGFITLCVMATFITVVVATAAALFERLLKSAVEIKSENDLTV